jgi:GTP pyrophosphokinase
LNRLIKKHKYDNFNSFYTAIALDKIKIDTLFAEEEEVAKPVVSEFEFEDFAKITRTDVGGVIIEGDVRGVNYAYAKCCNPIPGDPIVGFITTGEGIKIHRKNCDNVLQLGEKNHEKFIRAEWSKTIQQNFVGAISIKGEDSPGLLMVITNNINSYKNTNIKVLT